MENTLWKWEMFKSESEKAAKIAQEEKVKCYLVFVPTLKQFNATTKPHNEDEIIETYNGHETINFDEIYEAREANLRSLITSFSVWMEYNRKRI